MEKVRSIFPDPKVANHTRTSDTEKYKLDFKTEKNRNSILRVSKFLESLNCFFEKIFFLNFF